LTAESVDLRYSHSPFTIAACLFEKVHVAYSLLLAKRWAMVSFFASSGVKKPIRTALRAASGVIAFHRLGSSPYALRNDLTNGELYSIPTTAKSQASGALFSIASRCSSFVSNAVATGQTESALR